MDVCGLVFGIANCALLFSAELYFLYIFQNTTKFFIEKNKLLTLAVLFPILWGVSLLNPSFTLGGTAVLFGAGLLLGESAAASLCMAMLSAALLELDTGLWNTVAILIYKEFLFPWLGMQNPQIRKADLVMSVLICDAMLLSFWGIGIWILRRMKPRNTPGSTAVLLLPVFLILLVAELIPGTIYGNTVEMKADPEHGAEIIFPQVNNLHMLLIYLAAYGCLLAVLSAVRKMADGAEASTKMALLEQQVHAQESYVREARDRLALTRSFRHDINSHFQVLTGLLKEDNVSETVKYIEKLQNTAESLYFPSRTGNPAVDALLGSKLAQARRAGIRIDCTAEIPPGCPIDDMDLCVMLGNAADNALNGCLEAEWDRWISLTSRRKKNLLTLQIENSCGRGGSFREGIGIANIRTAAAKYGGAVRAQKEDGVFRLGILLLLS